MNHSMSGVLRLSYDFAKLVNNSEGSDVKFLVGKSKVLLYGHSIILRTRSRYFSNLLSDGKKWKEKSDGVILKPNVSPAVFTAILHYLYTGRQETISAAFLVDVIVASEEMQLGKLSVECQKEAVGLLMSSFGDKDIDEGESEDGFPPTIERPPLEPMPVDFVISEVLIPALIVAEQH